METAPLFKHVLLSLEQEPFQPLLENEIYNLVQKQIPESYGELSAQEKAELIAFRFLEPSKSKDVKLGYYFKPVSVTEKEDGSINEFPSISMVTKDTIAYWTYRLEQTRHPVLAARYAGLIYEFSLSSTGTKPPFSIIKKYMDALLALVNQKLYKVPLYAIGKIGRALDVALSINNSELIDRCKAAILKLEDEIAIADKPGLWGFAYDFLINGKRKLASGPEELSIIQTLEERFQNMIMVDSWCSECAAKRLMNHYHVKKQTEEIKRIISGLEASYSNSDSGLNPFQKVYHTEKIYGFYKQFGLNEEADIFLKKLREYNKETDKEMKSISGEINIPRDKIDQYVDQVLTGGSSEVIFARIIESGTPRVEMERQELERLSKDAPLQFILSKDLLDNKGRRVAKIPPISEDFESHLIQQYSHAIRIGTVLLDFVFREAINRDILSLHELMKFLRQSSIIEKDRFSIIQKGLEAYFSGDYMVAIHLLVPQFEEATRNLVEINGGSVMVQKGDAFNLKTFDHLLKDEIVTDVFGEDKAFYFRVLFTDRRGWNMRNNIAHGMLDVPHFLNKQNIDRILHAVLCLGMVRLVEK